MIYSNATRKRNGPRKLRVALARSGATPDPLLQREKEISASFATPPLDPLQCNERETAPHHPASTGGAVTLPLKALVMRDLIRSGIVTSSLFPFPACFRIWSIAPKTAALASL